MNAQYNPNVLTRRRRVENPTYTGYSLYLTSSYGYCIVLKGDEDHAPQNPKNPA